MKMKRAGIFLLTSMLMGFTLSSSVMAEETMESYEQSGMDIALSSLMEGTKGMVFPESVGAVDAGHHTYMTAFIYLAWPAEEVDWMNLSDEDEAAMRDAQNLLGVVLGTDQSLDSSKEVFDSQWGDAYQLDYDSAVEAGTADGYSFYTIPVLCDDYLSSIDEVYAEEYKKLSQALIEASKSAHYYAPVDDAKKVIGNKVQFTTSDLDGNTVTSEELFSANEITMVNCWGTWCPNCTDEMAELAQIHSRMQEKGCGIVGLEWENDSSEETFQLAKDQMKEYGTNYPNALLPMEDLPWVSAFPTSFFVDKEGTILSAPLAGAYVDEYEKVLASLLAEKKAPAAEDQAKADEAAEAEDTSKAAEEAEASAPATADKYTVHVVDENGPVADAAVQLCTDASCNFQTTDENGIATFEKPDGDNCEIHLAEAPEGYKEDETVYHPDESGEVTIQLQKE